MAAQTDVLKTSDILRLHEELETKHGDGEEGNFLFGWQSSNPFADELIAVVKERAHSIDYTKYCYMESDDGLAANVLSLHSDFDGIRPDAAFCAASGGTSILFALSYWLARKDIKEVYYLPPIYFTLLSGLRQFGIRARAVTGHHAFESDFRMNLPEKQTVLIFADPIWYAGIPVPEAIVEELAAWQRRTGSMIVVDGSFQYMRWDGRISEPTSRLQRDQTIRLVSPTKSLVVHGYRFAYALLPAPIKTDFSHSYANICGPSGADNVAFAYLALDAMRSRHITEQLMLRASDRHQQLRQKGKIDSPLKPELGYFVFAKINVALPDHALRMDGRYFGQPRFSEHVRFNLLSTKFHLLEA